MVGHHTNHHRCFACCYGSVVALCKVATHPVVCICTSNSCCFGYSKPFGLLVKANIGRDSSIQGGKFEGILYRGRGGFLHTDIQFCFNHLCIGYGYFNKANTGKGSSSTSHLKTACIEVGRAIFVDKATFVHRYLLLCGKLHDSA